MQDATKIHMGGMELGPLWIHIHVWHEDKNVLVDVG
jgi:hypothetical protein